MPRKLPWLVGAQSTSATTPPRPRRTAKITPSRARPHQQRRDNDDNDLTAEGTPNRRTPRGQARTPSTSPPPEAPQEEYMIEGRDADDVWRMVEDEMISIAHTFTQHLHHQEYLRQKQAAKSRNSRTIDTISRPVMGAMPDHTKRKVESITRARTQNETVNSILGKQPRRDSDVESDEDEVPAWIGTSLHGLMEQPKKSSQSLSQAVPISAPTRAAAGFKRPRRAGSQPDSSPPLLPSLRSEIPKAPRNTMHASDATATATESETEDEDDLDAPIRRPVILSNTQLSAQTEPKKPPPNFTTQTAQNTVTKRPEIDGIDSIDFATERPVKAVSSRLEKIRKRLEEAKQKTLKEEEEPNLHEIPTFL